MLVELNLVDGTGFDLPVQGIISIEGMLNTKNPNFPNANSYVVIRHPNGEVINLLVTNKFEELESIGNNGSWLRLTTGGNPLLLRKDVVYHRTGNDEGSEIIATIDGKLLRFEVKESITAIREAMKVAEPPEGVTIIPFPQPA